MQHASDEHLGADTSFGMPTKHATAAKRPDLSVKGGGEFHSPEPGLAAKAAAELETATLRALHQKEAGDGSAQAALPVSGTGSIFTFTCVAWFKLN